MRNSLTRLICYVGAAASVLTLSTAWLVYAAVAVVALAVAGAAVFSAPAPCRRPTTVNFSMNLPRCTPPGTSWQASCRYDTHGRLARVVVAARTLGLPPGADPTPYNTVPSAGSLDPLGDSLNFAFGHWRRPIWKQDSAVDVRHSGVLT